MNRRNFLCIACAAPLAPAVAMGCHHEMYEWPRTAIGEDRIRQCIKCGDKEKLKMQWGGPVRTDTFASVWNEQRIGDWVADGNSNPKWIREFYALKIGLA